MSPRDARVRQGDSCAGAHRSSAMPPPVIAVLSWTTTEVIFRSCESMTRIAPPGLPKACEVETQSPCSLCTCESVHLPLCAVALRRDREDSPSNGTMQAS